MFHEIRTILSASGEAQLAGKKTVLVTVVALEGSAYRRPGVRMLIREDGLMQGAVSGGCVEKEVLRQSEDVFKSGKPKLMIYDGRFRLGCEGQLYILIEPFDPGPEFYKAFEDQRNSREPLQIDTFFKREEGIQENSGSVFRFWSGDMKAGIQEANGPERFSQSLAPAFRLFVVGAEHDAVQLCKYAAETGWEVTVVAAPDEQKDADYFQGAEHFITPIPEEFKNLAFDKQTAVILMTHSYVKDMKYLMGLADKELAYLGLLGPKHRRERLLNEFMDKDPELPLEFFDRIHGPCGINIGAETPQEIAISIIAEILSVVREQAPIPLKDKTKGIHS